MRESDVLAYCTGLIIVCTVLLVISTVVTIRNCQLLRRLSAGPAGAHDEPPDPGPPPSRRRPAVERYDSERYDSAEAADSGALEWTGPVMPYTPPDRPPGR